jgi:hypothetical protein
MRSENLAGAEDQQERLIKVGWVVGFVDGEGCFSIGFVRQPRREGRTGYRAGYQVFHRFVVTQGARSASCLEELNGFFGVGRIYVNRRNDNHREHLHQFLVGRREHLLETVSHSVLHAVSAPIFQAGGLLEVRRLHGDRLAR